MGRRGLTKKHLLKDYRELKKTLGRQPTAREFIEKHHGDNVLSRAFGRPGWRNLLSAAGDRSLRELGVTEDMLLRAYRSLKKKLGRQPDYLEYKKEYYGLWILDRVFGKPGWRRLVQAAGDTPFIKSTFTAGTLIQDYRALKKKLGRQPFLYEYREACHGEWIIDRIFGKPGWRPLVEAAGDKLLTESNFTAEHLVKDFLDLQKRLGRRPRSGEYRRQCHPPKVLDRVFGKPGWRRFIQALGNKAKPEIADKYPYRGIAHRRRK